MKYKTNNLILEGFSTRWSTTTFQRLTAPRESLFFRQFTRASIITGYKTMTDSEHNSSPRPKATFMATDKQLQIKSKFLFKFFKIKLCQTS